MISIVAVCIVVIVGFGIYQSTASSAEPELSKKEIEDLIQLQYPGTITALELEKDDNNAFYTVAIENDGNEYNVILDGNTGKVLNMKTTEKVHNEGTSQDEDDKNQPSITEPPKKDKPIAPEKDASETKKKEASPSHAMISQKRAKEIALAEFKGKITEVELDDDDGRKLYEIELENGDSEATIEIDAYTGKIIFLEIDVADQD